MMKTALVGAAFLSLAVAAGAQAKTYDFSFLNATDVGSGTFDVSGTTVTGVTGAVDNSKILGLSPYAGSDQHVSLTSPFVTFPGISFSTAVDIYNLYSNPGDFLLKASVDPVGFPQNGQAIALSVSAVPEPGTWVMMLGGIGLMGASLRYSRKRGVAARTA